VGFTYKCPDCQRFHHESTVQTEDQFLLCPDCETRRRLWALDPETLAALGVRIAYKCPDCRRFHQSTVQTEDQFLLCPDCAARQWARTRSTMRRTAENG